MSNQQDNLDAKLSDAKANMNRLLDRKKPRTSAVEVAKTGSPMDYVLWAVAAVALISTTFINKKLPGYWAMANETWVQIAIIVALVLLALVSIALTHQGKAFKTLLVDAGVELRRVTWPTKPETFHWTWVVLLVIFIIGLIVWILDNIFNQIIGFLIG